MREQRGPLEARRARVRGCRRGFRFAHGLEAVADIVQPEHRCADGGPARTRREIVEDLPHRWWQPAKTSQHLVVIARPKRAPERSGFGTDPDRWLGCGPAVVRAKLIFKERAVVRIADDRRGGEWQTQA